MDDDQQFCLRWNNHQSTLVAVFDTLLENGTLVDCTLAAEGKCLNAHKVVLSACSPYFEALLSKHFDKHPILILKDVKFQELKAMMDYMYRGEVNISQDQLGALLKAAESLQIKGLSDNRKGETERKPAPIPPAPKSPQPTSAIPKVQGLTIEQRSRDDSREGSMSPGPRKKKRLRRKSEELDNHDASNSSESHSLPAQNIPSSLPAASKLNADVPEPVETKSEILTRHKQDDIPQVPIIKEKIETHTELMLEPKSEYVEEMNEDSIEDLTLDDDDLSNMEQVDDQAGPSHGNTGEGSSQGFGGWHMGNQSQDEVFLAAQEAVGAHRDSQDFMYQDSRSLLELVKIEEFHEYVPYSPIIPVISSVYSEKEKIRKVKSPIARKPKVYPKKVKLEPGSPRITYYQNRSGNIIQTYRCLKCSSFVKKEQPVCNNCLGIKKESDKGKTVKPKSTTVKNKTLLKSIKKEPTEKKSATLLVNPLRKKKKPSLQKKKSSKRKTSKNVKKSKSKNTKLSKIGKVKVKKEISPPKEPKKSNMNLIKPIKQEKVPVKIEPVSMEIKKPINTSLNVKTRSYYRNSSEKLDTSQLNETTVKARNVKVPANTTIKKEPNTVKAKCKNIKIELHDSQESPTKPSFSNVQVESTNKDKVTVMTVSPSKLTVLTPEELKIIRSPNVNGNTPKKYPELIVQRKNLQKLDISQYNNFDMENINKPTHSNQTVLEQFFTRSPILNKPTTDLQIDNKSPSDVLKFENKGKVYPKLLVSRKSLQKLEPTQANLSNEIVQLANSITMKHTGQTIQEENLEQESVDPLQLVESVDDYMSAKKPRLENYSGHSDLYNSSNIEILNEDRDNLTETNIGNIFEN